MIKWLQTRACCGIKPFVFGGWCEPACAAHDIAYEQSATSGLSRAYVDYKFLLDCLELAKKGQFKKGKVAASYTMYGIVRATGSLFWDGKE